MNLQNILNNIKNAGAFTISLKLLALYAAGVLMFWLVHKKNIAMRPWLQNLGRQGKGAVFAAVFVVVGLTNLLCAYGFKWLGIWISQQPRMMMLVVPLLIVGEFEFKRVKAASESDKPAEYGALAGMTAGILAGIYLFFWNAPIK